MRRTEHQAAVLLLALLPAAGWAQDSAAAQVAAAKPSGPSGKVEQTKDQLTKLPSAADLRPTGPVTINANRAELVQGNSAVYIGNVTLDSDTLKMDGDRLELKRAPDGQYTAKITGAPAHMSHAGNGPDNPPVTARAKVMTYDSRSGVIDLNGDALMTRGNDKTTAENIRYHVLEQRYEADGGSAGGSRVQIVIPQVPAPGGAAPLPAPAIPANAPTTPVPAKPPQTEAPK